MPLTTKQEKKLIKLRKKSLKQFAKVEKLYHKALKTVNTTDGTALADWVWDAIANDDGKVSAIKKFLATPTKPKSR